MTLVTILKSTILIKCIRNLICSSSLIIAKVLILAIGMHSCVDDDEFKVPEPSSTDPVIEGNIIKPGAVLGMLKQAILREGKMATLTFDDTNTYVRGYVISDDTAGNHFKELIIQDEFMNATAGIKIAIDINPLYTTYEFGRKIYVQLDGLTIGLENEVPVLGVLDRNKVDKIPSFLETTFILRASEVAKITAKRVTIDDFSDDLLHQYILLDKVQFADDEVLIQNPLTFAAESFDRFNGERTLESCNSGQHVILSTSTFSDFRGLELPKGQGSFMGILTKNFFGDTYNVVLNDPTGLVFEGSDRCAQ